MQKFNKDISLQPHVPAKSLLNRVKYQKTKPT